MAIVKRPRAFRNVFKPKRLRAYKPHPTREEIPVPAQETQAQRRAREAIIGQRRRLRAGSTPLIFMNENLIV
jgi:hypothetical protein